MQVKVIERINQIIANLGIKQIEFCKKAKISQGTLSGAKTSNSSLREDTIISIARAYPNLNTNWLLLGEGEMWKVQEKPASQTAINVGTDNTIIQNHQTPASLVSAPTPAYSEDCARLLKEKESEINSLKEQVSHLSGQIVILERFANPKKD